MTMRDAAVMPLQIVKNRFYSFAQEVSRIWADFWITCYGKRKIKLTGSKGTWYMPFDSQRYLNLIINAKINVGAGTVYSERECVNTLITLYEKGIIDRAQFIKRLPDGIVPDREGLLADGEKEEISYDGV